LFFDQAESPVCDSNNRNKQKCDFNSGSLQGTSLQVLSIPPSNGRRGIPGFKQSFYSQVKRITKVSDDQFGYMSRPLVGDLWAFLLLF